MDNSLLNPDKLWSRAEVLGPTRPVPKASGVYAWYFRDVPPEVPTDGCIRYGDLTLLYAGISPKAPPSNGRSPSSQTIYDRIRYHYTGNAEGSTLRLTLGCLLSEQLGITLRRVGSGKRMTFSNGEQTLSEWMAENAYVTWLVHPEPWAAEEELIRQISLPLNLDQNRHHGFHQVLSAKRAEAKAQARALPVLAR